MKLTCTLGAGACQQNRKLSPISSLDDILFHYRTFYSYPVQTTVSLEFNSIAFPAITICNMNPVKNGKLHMEPALEEVLRKGQSPVKNLN